MVGRVIYSYERKWRVSTQARSCCPKKKKEKGKKRRENHTQTPKNPNHEKQKSWVFRSLN
jgi:hypothetical protein